MAEVDIATLGIKVDATTANEAASQLDRLVIAGERTEKNTRSVALASNEMKAAIQSAIGAINANTTAMGAFQDRLNGAKTASNGAASAVDNMEARVSRLRAVVDPMGAAMGRVNNELAEARALYSAGAIGAEEYQRQITILNARLADFQRRQLMLNEGMGIGARSAKLQAHETLNLSRQFADIGVTAAMGMNPIMIAIQQGPQIADVLQTARARGISTASAFKQMGASLLPFLKYIEMIGTVGGLAFGTLFLAARGASEGLGNVQKELGLTDKQMDRLKDKGTDLGFTMGDVFAGIAAAAADMIGFDEIAKNWDNLLDFLGRDAIKFVRDVVGIFGGLTGAIKAGFNDIPGSIAAVFQMAIIEYLKFVNDLLQKSTNVINNFRSMIGLEGNLKAWQVEIPKMSAGAARAGGALERGFAEGRDSAQSAFDKGMGAHRRSRILEDAGDPDKERKKRERKPRESQEEKDWESATKAANDYIKSLREATEQMGLNEVETKQLATAKAQAAIEEAAHKAQLAGVAVNMKQVHNLTLQMSQAQYDWEQKLKSTTLRDMKRDLADVAAQEKYEAELLGMNNVERERAIVLHNVEMKVRDAKRRGITIDVAELEAETAALLRNATARGNQADAAQHMTNIANASHDAADAIKEVTSSFGELFGTAGEGFSNLINVIADYSSAQADSAAELANLQRQYGEHFAENAQYQIEAGRIQDKAAQSQINNYGNMIHAAKTFFKEGSTGWRIMEAAERAYRLFQFAMMVRSMIMDTAHTAKSVANSGARAAADGVAAVAKAIASLPFPLNIIAGAATLAFLIAIGVKMMGKGGGKGASASASSQTEKVDKYTGPTDQYGSPTSYYSVLRPGDTTVANNRSAPGYMQNGIQVSTGDTHIIIQGDMADNTLNRLVPVLEAHQTDTVDKARQAVASDFATRAGRQVIGGGA